MDSSNIPAEMAEEQDASNIYDVIYDSLLTMPQHLVLARSTYGEDFVKNIVSNNVWEYRSEDRKHVHETILVGEIRPATCGTRFSAVGNHYMGSIFNPTYIDDSSRVKSVFVLGKPQDATKEFSALFDNQLATLTEVLDRDKEEVPSKNIAMKEWTASADGERESDPDYIVIVTNQMYAKPKEKMTVVKSTPRKKTRLEERSSTMKSSVEKPVETAKDEDFEDMVMSEDGIDGITVEDSPAESIKTSSSKGKEKAKELTTNDFHPPSLLSDYGGDLFRHAHAKLQQLDFRNIDDELIPPQEWYSELRQGTLVLVRATMHTYTWPTRRVYQLGAQTIRVLRRSNLEVETRKQVVLEPDNTPKKTENSEAAAMISQVVLGKRTRG